MAEQLPDHGQALAERQGAGGKAVTEVVDAHVVEACARPDAPPGMINGMDVTRRPSGKWIIDFGHTMSEADAALYEAPFAHVLEHVKPVRDRNRRDDLRRNWWRHDRSGQTMFQRIGVASRYIATPTVAKHRLFVWLDSRVCPDHPLIVIARDDDTTFGILHSRFHEAWSLRLGTSLEDRPRYTPTTTFETFPFPQGLSPDIPAAAYADDPRTSASAEAARRLVALRDRWLNPPEWVEWLEEPIPGYPRRPAPRDEAVARELKKRTLTALYNTRPQWLTDAHTNLDAAVAAAYGWGVSISDEEALRELLERNRSLGTLQRGTESRFRRPWQRDSGSGDMR